MSRKLYEFRPEDAERFAREQGSKTKKRGNQLVFLHCPYCKANDKETFSINLDNGQFNCKRSSCSVKGNMITLARDFNFSINRDVDAYYQTTDYSKKQYKQFRDAHKQIETRIPAVEYLAKRGISEETCRKFEITTKKDDDSTLVFPFKDESGELTYVKYRNMAFVKGETKGSKEYSEKNCKPILFGMNHCESDEQLIVTEGQIDSLSVYESGIKNAVSVPNGCNGFTWIPYCWDFMSKFKSIVVFGDCENGKITLAEELSKRWDTVKIARPEDYRGCKDANEILQKYGKQAVQDVIKNASLPDDRYIKPLSKVQRVDILKIPAIQTRIPEIDETLDGGFHLGQLGVLTGKRGEGKSTIASMFGVHALDQNYKCFFYSGELVDFYFRNWMDCQVTGSKEEKTQSENDMLNKWYGDKAYIYDNSAMSEETELPKLKDKIEKAIVQYGCQFILVDNLMTAIDDDLATDLYRAQSKFVGDMATLAKRYNVFVLLIAHPRKGEVNDNDSIAGSSNITDKADIVMMYGKSNRDGATEDDRIMRITKNRLTGKIRTEKEPIKLVYDSSGSRRIASCTKDFFKMHFDWKDDDLYNEMTEGFIKDDDAPF